MHVKGCCGLGMDLVDGDVDIEAYEDIDCNSSTEDPAHSYSDIDYGFLVVEYDPVYNLAMGNDEDEVVGYNLVEGGCMDL